MHVHLAGINCGAAFVQPKKFHNSLSRSAVNVIVISIRSLASQIIAFQPRPVDANFNLVKQQRPLARLAGWRSETRQNLQSKAAF